MIWKRLRIIDAKSLLRGHTVSTLIPGARHDLLTNQAVAVDKRVLVVLGA
jgi:hypothetical protein